MEAEAVKNRNIKRLDWWGSPESEPRNAGPPKDVVRFSGQASEKAYQGNKKRR